VVNELRGVQFIDGEMVVVAIERTPEGERTVTMPVDVAHGVGCILIELCQLAKEREEHLRESGELLEVEAIREEFASRVRRRHALNGSEENVYWRTVVQLSGTAGTSQT
jgi:hypothetical protein